MLKRRREECGAKNRIITVSQNGEQRYFVVFPKRQQPDPEQLEIFDHTSTMNMSHGQQANRHIPNTSKKGRTSSTMSQTEYNTKSPILKANGEIVSDSPSNKNVHFEDDAEVDHIARDSPTKSLTVDDVDIATKLSDTVAANTVSGRDRSPVSRSSLSDKETSSISDITESQDTATDPSLLDGGIGGNDHGEDPGSQPDEIRYVDRKRYSMEVNPAQHKSKQNRRKSLSNTQDILASETKTNPFKVRESPVVAEEHTNPIESIELLGSIEFLEFGGRPQRYECDTRETWTIQANSQNTSPGERWHNVIAVRAIATAAAKRHRFSIRFTSNQNVVEQQWALTIQQQRYVIQLLEKLHKEAADTKQEGSWVLENLELGPKGKAHNDLMSIKITLRWQSRENPTLPVKNSKDTTDEELDTEVEVLTKFRLGRWHLVHANDAVDDTISTAKTPIEYPGHPNRKAPIRKGEYNADRRPELEDFGIPGILHRPTLWDRLRGRTGICKECVRLFKNLHVDRFGEQATACERCQYQYIDKLRAWRKADEAWEQGLPIDASMGRRGPVQIISSAAEPSAWSDTKPSTFPEAAAYPSNMDSDINNKVSNATKNSQSSSRAEAGLTPYRPSKRSLEIVKSITKRSRPKENPRWRRRYTDYDYNGADGDLYE